MRMLILQRLARRAHSFSRLREKEYRSKRDLSLAFAAVLALAAIHAHAHDNANDQDKARGALERENGRWVCEIGILSVQGEQREIMVDASLASGARRRLTT